MPEQAAKYNCTAPTTPVVLVPALNSSSQYAICTTWHRGTLLVSFNPAEVDVETATYVAGVIAGGPVRVDDIFSATDPQA